MIVCGATFLALRREPDVRVAAAVSACIALQMAGQSAVMIRDWFGAAGTGSISLSSLADIVTLASATTTLSLVAAAVAGAAAMPLFTGRLRAPNRMLGPAIAVLLAVPALAVLVFGLPPLTGSVKILLAWSLPWSVTLAAAGWAPPVVRHVLTGVGAASVAVTALGTVLPAITAR